MSVAADGRRALAREPDARRGLPRPRAHRRRGRRPDGAAGGRGIALAARGPLSRSTRCAAPRAGRRARIVTFSASRCSSSAWANLREVPSSSRSWASVIEPPCSAAIAITRRAHVRQHVGVVVQRPRDPTARPASRSAARSAASSSESSGGSSPASRSRCSSASAEADSGSGCGAAAGGGSDRRVGGRRGSGSAGSPRDRRSRRVSRSRDGPCLRGAGIEHARRRRSCPAARSGARRAGRRAAATSGCSSRICQKRPPSQASRAGASRVPWWICTRVAVLGVARRRTPARRRAGTPVAGPRPPTRPRRRGRPRRPRRR